MLPPEYFDSDPFYDYDDENKETAAFFTSPNQAMEVIEDPRNIYNEPLIRLAIKEIVKVDYLLPTELQAIIHEVNRIAEASQNSSEYQKFLSAAKIFFHDFFSMKDRMKETSIFCHYVDQAYIQRFALSQKELEEIITNIDIYRDLYSEELQRLYPEFDQYLSDSKRIFDDVRKIKGNLN